MQNLLGSTGDGRGSNKLTLRKPAHVAGHVRPPGSKSLTNRHLFCAALASGVSRLAGVSLAEDAYRMLAGLAALGVRVDVDESLAELVVHGCGGRLRAHEADIDAGAAGTAMRFLAALAATGEGRYRLDGNARMRERPISELVEGLRALGALVGYEAREGYPPIRIAAGGLLGGEVVLTSTPSSQFLSALLMASPTARVDVMIEVRGHLPSRPYVDMTVGVMKAHGVELIEEGQRFIVPAPQPYGSAHIDVEPDASAASYFWAAAAMAGGTVRVNGLTRESVQGDVRFVDLLEQMGCHVTQQQDGLAVQGPPRGALRGITADLTDMPDVAQTLAVTALAASGPTRITELASLRIKETDRIAALAAELSKFGATVQAGADWIEIEPPATPTPAEVSTYDDHRMAMSFTLASLLVDGVTICHPGCVAKSYPGFFEDWTRLVAE